MFKILFPLNSSAFTAFWRIVMQRQSQDIWRSVSSRCTANSICTGRSHCCMEQLLLWFFGVLLDTINVCVCVMRIHDDSNQASLTFLFFASMCDCTCKLKRCTEETCHLPEGLPLSSLLEVCLPEALFAGEHCRSPMNASWVKSSVSEGFMKTTMKDTNLQQKSSS